jgi:UDP-galactopyranose mutase
MYRDVLCLSHLRWGFVFQRPNHLMSRCARERRVFFVEEPVLDADMPRMDISLVRDGLHVAVPHLRPGTCGEAAEEASRLLVADLVERAHVEEPLLWFYTPMALAHVPSHVVPRGIVYDCMDELASFHGAPPLLKEREKELFRRADLVFTGGHSLFEAKRRHHARVHAFPSSVDAAHFASARTEMPGREPADQRGLPHPRLGFFGVVDERMDIALLRELAEARPTYQLVVIGPVVKIDRETLPTLPNIHWLGQKRYEELPAYLAGWDVAIMPFARNDATKYISPTKTLEYLAAGKPVVSTSIRDVVRPFGEQGLVRIADEPLAFAAACDAALAEMGTKAADAHHAACDGLLAQTSWDGTWKRMSRLVEQVLTSRRRSAPPVDARSPFARRLVALQRW